MRGDAAEVQHARTCKAHSPGPNGSKGLLINATKALVALPSLLAQFTLPPECPQCCRRCPALLVLVLCPLCLTPPSTVWGCTR